MKKPLFNPALEAAKATAQAIAAPAAAQPAEWRPKKPRGRPTRDISDSTPQRIQVLVRRTPAARKRLKHAAWAARISEQELVERFALSLGDV